MMDVIAKALNEQRRALHRTFVPQPPGASEIQALTLAFKGSEVERMLRIEIERDLEPEFARWLQYTGQSVGKSFFAHQGPWTFQGVDVYVVNVLPAPGWRIINPLVR